MMGENTNLPEDPTPVVPQDSGAPVNPEEYDQAADLDEVQEADQDEDDDPENAEDAPDPEQADG